MLRRHLLWNGLGAGWRELEADEPITGDAVTAHFGRSELPAAGGFESKVGKILTGATRIERGFSNIACGVDVHADADAHDALNGGASLLGDLGQNLFEDFTARGR